MAQRFFVLILVFMSVLVPPVRSQDLTWDVVTSPVEGAIGFQALYVTPKGSLVANVGSGMFTRSTDNGTTWISLFIPGGGIASTLTVGDDGLLYIMDGEGQLSVSYDEGDSYTPLATPPDAMYYSVFVARNGDIHLYSSDLKSSTDRGVTWRTSLAGAVPICMATDGTGRLYAGVVDSGVHVSDDRGVSWKKTGLVEGYTRVVYPASSGFLFAGVQGLGGTGKAFVSGDRGDSWSSTPLQDVVAAMTGTPTGVVYAAAANSGIYRSSDNGGSWTRHNNGLTDVRVLQVVLHPSGHLFAANAFGNVFRSNKVVYVAETEKEWSDLQERVTVRSDPSSGSILVRTTDPAAAPLHLVLYNATGELIRTVDLEAIAGGGEASIDIMDLSSGTYLYTVGNGGEIISGVLHVLR